MPRLSALRPHRGLYSGLPAEAGPERAEPPLRFYLLLPVQAARPGPGEKGREAIPKGFPPTYPSWSEQEAGQQLPVPWAWRGQGRWRHHWAEPTLSLNFPRRAVPGWMGVEIWPGIQDHGEAWGEGHGHLWGLPVGRGVEPGLGLGIWEQCRPRSRLPSRHAACHLQHQCSGLVSCGERRLFQSLEGACACMGSFALFPLASVPLSVPGSGLGA